MAEDRPGYSFDPGPPPEASRFLANKGLKPAFSWRDVEPEEHAIAFTVAKATQLDVLTTIRTEVQRALDQGVPFAKFQRELRPRLEKLGWWGQAEMVDPVTGKTVDAQLGSPRRLKTIYEANIRSARAAGQWDRIQRNKRALPYLQYNLGPSIEHRPEHEARAGLVLPADDPIWDTWYPPNGWGCKCWVRQLTRHEAEDLGVDQAAPAAPTREVRNKRTGVVKQVPVGIDPGWERNPGKLRLETVEQLLDERLEAAVPAVRKVALRDIASSWQVRRITEGGPGRAPVAMLPARATDVLPGKPRIVHWTRASADHVIEDKAGDRRPAILALADLEDASASFVVTSARGDVSAHFQLMNGDKPHHAVVWFDDGARIRTVFPTDAGYFDRVLRQARSRGGNVVEIGAKVE